MGRSAPAISRSRSPACRADWRRPTSWPSSRLTAQTRPSDHGGATVTSWPRARRSAIDVVAGALLDEQRARREAARVERRRSGARCGTRARRSPPAGSSPRSTWRRRTCSAHCSCWSPPGVPYASHGSPSRSTSPGESVVRGRLRGCSDDGRPSSSQNICARVPSGQPSAGMTGELCSQPPLGVAENRLPKRSATSRWTVSPRVGSPTPSDSSVAGRVEATAGGPARAGARRDASSPTSLRRSSLYSVESSVSSGTGGVAVERVAVGERELRALGDDVDELGSSLERRRRRSRRAARAAASPPAPGPTAPSCTPSAPR